MKIKTIATTLAMGIACMGLLSSTINADERHFGYSYESDSVLPKGKVEFEQWATLRSGKENGVYSRWDLRHEIEYGFTETLTGALYVNTSSTYASGVNGIDDTNSLQFHSLSGELKKMIRSPHLNPVGVLLYFEPAYSGKEFELEEKLILQHIHNEKWNYVANIISEIEWKYDSEGTTEEAVLGLTGGVSYQINPNLSTGFETKIESEFEGIYSEYERTSAFVGPNIHFGANNFQLTGAVLKQVTNDLANAESLEVRIIAGIFF